jgi:hypothetical protein
MSEVIKRDIDEFCGLYYITSEKEVYFRGRNGDRKAFTNNKGIVYFVRAGFNTTKVLDKLFQLYFPEYAPLAEDEYWIKGYVGLYTVDSKGVVCRWRGDVKTPIYTMQRGNTRSFVTYSGSFPECQYLSTVKLVDKPKNETTQQPALSVENEEFSFD